MQYHYVDISQFAKDDLLMLMVMVMTLLVVDKCTEINSDSYNTVVISIFVSQFGNK